MRRNSFKLFVMFGLILFLGVGYAVVNSVTLTVGGSANAGTSAMNVVFTGQTYISDKENVIVNVQPNSINASFSISNMTLNSKKYVDLYIKNYESDVAADVTISASGSNEYFLVSALDVQDSKQWFSIQPSSERTVRISVEMIKTPITNDDSLLNFTVSINAMPVQSGELISFSIDGKTYQAVSGMRMIDWVFSDYNYDNFGKSTTHFGCNSTFLGGGGLPYIIESNNQPLMCNTLIVDSESYVTDMSAVDLL